MPAGARTGGDCYDFVPLLVQRLGLVIGDASGKGLAAALMMANVLSSIRTAALFTGNDVAAALSAVNRQVHSSSLPDRYATLFYGVFDGRTRTLTYGNAGHNPPLSSGQMARLSAWKPAARRSACFPTGHTRRARLHSIRAMSSPRTVMESLKR
jgi:hypothetical protein